MPGSGLLHLKHKRRAKGELNREMRAAEEGVG